MTTEAKIAVWESYKYVEVFQITEMRDDCIYRTKSVGFAHRDRPKGEKEVYAALPMKLIRSAVDDHIILQLL